MIAKEAAMPVPGFQEFMLPLLKIVCDGRIALSTSACGGVR